MAPLMLGNIPPVFPSRSSRPSIGGAGIAGKSAVPVSGRFGNRGKVRHRSANLPVAKKFAAQEPAVSRPTEQRKESP